MAELRIQPKKPAPSPWLLVGLAALLVAAAAYFFLRPDPADEVAPPAHAAPVVADSLAAARPIPLPGPAPPGADSAAPAPAASYARATLLQLSPALTQLADRADLRDDAAVREQRDNFTSATARLEDGDPRASLRPGLVAAASLLLAVQQKAYPPLDAQAGELLREAQQLSGRDATPAEQAQNRAYLGHVAALLQAVSQPAGANL